MDCGNDSPEGDMLSLLASGTLTRDPAQRTSANGKPFATANMRVPTEDGEAMFVSLIAFSPEASGALMALRKGDSLSVAGRAKPTEWEKGGEKRHGLSVVVDQILTAYAVQRQTSGERRAA